MSVYKYIVSQIKDLAKNLYSFIPIEKRMGQKYWSLRHFLNTAQWWDQEKISGWQFTRTKKILNYAYSNVPGYYELYRSARISPDDIRSLSDMEHLPFTTKELLRDNLKDFTTSKIPKRQLNYITTGGSTGIPFGFYHTKTNKWMENAFIHSGWLRSGWQLGAPSIVLRGSFVGTSEKFYSNSKLRNEFDVSTYYLSENTYLEYFDFIVKQNTMAIQAYPSAITILSDLMQNHRHEGQINVKVLLLGSENLYDWQKEMIQKAFPNARLFAWYGHAEQVVLAPWCEKVDIFHAWPFYGYTELINHDNQPINIGQVGEIVGTSFWNYGTPFIRYRTMDFAESGGIGCNLCKREFPIFTKIEGRLQEFIISATGRYISMTAINMHSDIFDDVRQFQFYQDHPGKVILKIVPKQNFSEISSQKIFNIIKSKLSSDVDLTLEIVNDIPPTKNGKLRFLDQRLNLRYGDYNN